VGSTAIAIVGNPDYLSATPWVIKEFPENIQVYANLASSVGLHVKQAAGVFVSISKGVTIEQNSIFQSPRAGLVVNDGFGGGHVWRRNIVFETVLETNDHGPVDTWDRQQYEELYRPPCIVEENLILGNAAGPKGIDFDDGAFNWISRRNVIVWGYQKFKGSNIFATDNLILFPLDSACAFVTPQTRVPANWEFYNNTCVSYRPPYAYNGNRPELTTLCDPSNFDAQANTYYYLGAPDTFSVCGGTLVSWPEWRQKYGQDAGSTLTKKVPLISDLEQMVKDKLPWIGKIQSS